MAFVRGAWRILVGIKDALVLILLLAFFGLIFALLRYNPNPQVGAGGALLLELDGVIVEQPSELNPLQALTAAGPPMREYRARDVIRALDAARTDPRVKVVVLDLDRFLGGGRVTLATVGEHIDAVRKSGKPVYAFATAYAEENYTLAAHASEIWVDPLGGAIFSGPGGSQLYFRDALDRFGVTAHIYRVGTYKSAVEPFLRVDQSPEAKASTLAVYNEVWDNWVADMAKARPKARLKPLINDPAAMVDSAQGDLSLLAKSLGIVDRLGSRLDFGKMIVAKVGEATGKDKVPGSFATIDYDAWVAANPLPQSGPAIGVLTVSGDIIDGEAGPGTAGADTITEALYEAMAAGDLKALVVRVNSPGGSVTASEQIRRAVAEAKAQGLPVIVSMGDVAASGGYWISTAADTIFAEPSTLTGSIGIFAILPSFETILTKYGVNADGVRTSPLSGEPDMVGGFSADFDTVAQRTIEHGYRQFLARVSKARRITPAEADNIGQGRVWAGGTARQIGLVDRFGGLDDALAEAARLAKLQPGDWHARWLEPAPSVPFQILAGLLGGKDEARTAPLDLFGRARVQQERDFARLHDLMKLLVERRGAQALCLECAGTSVSAPRTGSNRGPLAQFTRWLIGESSLR